MRWTIGTRSRRRVAPAQRLVQRDVDLHPAARAVAEAQRLLGRGRGRRPRREQTAVELGRRRVRDHGTRGRALLAAGDHRDRRAAAASRSARPRWRSRRARRGRRSAARTRARSCSSRRGRPAARPRAASRRSPAPGSRCRRRRGRGRCAAPTARRARATSEPRKRVCEPGARRREHVGGEGERPAPAELAREPQRQPGRRRRVQLAPSSCTDRADRRAEALDLGEVGGAVVAGRGPRRSAAGRGRRSRRGRRRGRWRSSPPGVSAYARPRAASSPPSSANAPTA